MTLYSLTRRPTSGATLDPPPDTANDSIAVPEPSEAVIPRMCCVCGESIRLRDRLHVEPDEQVRHELLSTCNERLKWARNVYLTENKRLRKDVSRLTAENVQLRKLMATHPDMAAYKAPRSRTR